MIERLRRWFAYERDAHAKSLASLETVPAERRADAEYRQALDLLDHLIAARELWLRRLGVTEGEPVDPFPTGRTADELRAGLARMESAWEAHLAELDDAALASAFTYGAWEGGRFRSDVEDILVQLFGHSWYHRGQIARIVRRLGGEPAVTDFVYWAREPAEG